MLRFLVCLAGVMLVAQIKPGVFSLSCKARSKVAPHDYSCVATFTTPTTEAATLTAWIGADTDNLVKSIQVSVPVRTDHVTFDTGDEPALKAVLN